MMTEAGFNAGQNKKMKPLQQPIEVARLTTGAALRAIDRIKS